MTRQKLCGSVVAIGLLATLLTNATPVLARGSLHTVSAAPAALPMMCPAPTDPVTAQVMVDIDSAFVRKGASWTSVSVGRVVKFQCFLPTGRNTNAEWLLIPYGDTVGWIHGSMIRFRGDLMKLPLTENTVSRAVTTTILPKGLPVISYRSRAAYLGSARAGKDLRMFTVLGDCNSEPPVYLGRFAANGLDTFGIPALKSTALYFTQAFSRTSLATQGSFNASMAFDNMWADPKLCRADEGPLACELRVSKASILVIALGTGDQHTWKDFEAHYRAIVAYTVKAGVLPVLMTKADALESQEGGAPVGYINDVIRRVGKDYGAPVIDFWLATRDLANHGLVEERNGNLQTTNSFHLNEQAMDTRMLMTLQTLKAIAGR